MQGDTIGTQRNEIADLQHLLQQAQERIRELETCYLGEKWKELVAERDAAIERGIELWGWAEVANADINELAERAEAAERGLEAADSNLALMYPAYTAVIARMLKAEKRRDRQKARAEAAEALKPYARHPHYCANFLFQRECDCGLAEILAALAPAEALRAKHRSPQSGQEEAPDD